MGMFWFVIRILVVGIDGIVSAGRCMFVIRRLVLGSAVRPQQVEQRNGTLCRIGRAGFVPFLATDLRFDVVLQELVPSRVLRTVVPGK